MSDTWLVYDHQPPCRDDIKSYSPCGPDIVRNAIRSTEGGGHDIMYIKFSDIPNDNMAICSICKTVRFNTNTGPKYIVPDTHPYVQASPGANL